MYGIKNKIQFYLLLIFYWNLVFFKSFGEGKVEEWSKDFEADKPEPIKDPNKVNY